MKTKTTWIYLLHLHFQDEKDDENDSVRKTHLYLPPNQGSMSNPKHPFWIILAVMLLH